MKATRQSGARRRAAAHRGGPQPRDARSRTVDRVAAAEKARAARYASLLGDLDDAQAGLERGLQAAGNDEKLQGHVVDEFLRELVRVCRADSRLLEHPVAQRWVRQARAWGWRDLLRKMHRGLERGVRGPLTIPDVELWGQIDRRRERGQSLEAIRRQLVAPGKTRGTASKRGFSKRYARLDEVETTVDVVVRTPAKVRRYRAAVRARREGQKLVVRARRLDRPCPIRPAAGRPETPRPVPEKLGTEKVTLPGQGPTGGVEERHERDAAPHGHRSCGTALADERHDLQPRLAAPRRPSTDPNRSICPVRDRGRPLGP